MDHGQSVGKVNMYEKTMLLFWVMKNLIGMAAWDKEAVEEAADGMDQWRASITANINQLNIKVDLLLKRLRVLVLLAPPRVTSLKPAKEGPCQGGIPNLPYVLL